jgi:hypothetical protein
MKRLLLGLALILVVACVGISIWVELEGPYVFETVGGTAVEGRALVLYHPSREAHFSDDLSLAFANGLMSEGFSVDRATLTAATSAHPEGYALIAIVSNTYYWTPDRPTLRYLARAHLGGVAVIGLLGGAGSTSRAQRVLQAALNHTGATVLGVESFWLYRPNDAARPSEPNRAVALDRAQQLGKTTGARVLAGAVPTRSQPL